jgi:hypothetical protein
LSAEVGSAPGLAGAGRAPDMPQRVITAAQAWCRTRGGGQRSVLRAGTERSVPGVLRCDLERCRAGRKDRMRLRWAQRCTRSLWIPLKVSRRSGPVRLVVCDLGRIRCEALTVARGARGHQVPATATTRARGVAGVIRRGPEARLPGLWGAGRTCCDMTITTSYSAHLRDEHVREAGRARQLEDAVRRRRSSVDGCPQRCISDKSYTEDNEALPIVVVEIMVR